ncbi:MAG: glutathione S-transferase [Salinisphaeraceae bacterium]|nr:glutathione S-transferase [Salinisphaeraceae bacterium]
MVEVTGLYTALCALLVLYLAWRVVSIRRREKIGLGDGGNKDLNLAIRAHANAVEYLPLSLLLILVAELNGLPALWLHLAGLALLACRVGHAWGFVAARGAYHPGRFFGIAGNWLLWIALALANGLLALG